MKRQALSRKRRHIAKKADIHLRNQIAHQRVRRIVEASVLGNTADHAAAVEWGTYNQDGYHVLGQTIDWIEAGA